MEKVIDIDSYNDLLNRTITGTSDIFGHEPTDRFPTTHRQITRHSKSNFRKLNSIELNPWIEFGNRMKSNTDSCVSSTSEPIKLNPLDYVRLNSATEHNPFNNGLHPRGGTPLYKL